MTVKGDRHIDKRGDAADLDPGAIEATGLLDTAQPDDPEQPDEDGPLGKHSATAETSPTPKTGWERTESVFRLLSLIAIAVSATVSAMNFYQGYLDAKKERSIALMSDWQAKGARDTYATLGDVLGPVVARAGPIPAGLPERARRLARRQIGANLTEELKAGDPEILATVSSKIDTVIVFFSEVEFCLRADLCDESLLKDYFESEVILFWDYFQIYVLEQRAGLYPAYGEAVEALALGFSEP